MILIVFLSTLAHSADSFSPYHPALHRFRQLSHHRPSKFFAGAHKPPRFDVPTFTALSAHQDGSPPPYDPLRTEELRFVRGSKGNPKLIIGGFSYFKNNCNTDRTYWLCSRNRKNKCNARIITKASTSEVMLKNQVHNHEPNFFENSHDDGRLITFTVVDSV